MEHLRLPKCLKGGFLPFKNVCSPVVELYRLMNRTCHIWQMFSYMKKRTVDLENLPGPDTILISYSPLFPSIPRIPDDCYTITWHRINKRPNKASNKESTRQHLTYSQKLPWPIWRAIYSSSTPIVAWRILKTYILVDTWMWYKHTFSN